MTTQGGVTIDLFKWIIGLLMSMLVVAFGFQQNQIARLDGKIDGFKDSVNPGLAAINENLAGMSKDIDWIKKTLGNAEISK